MMTLLGHLCVVQVASGATQLGHPPSYCSEHQLNGMQYDDRWRHLQRNQVTTIDHAMQLQKYPGIRPKHVRLSYLQE